MTSPDLKACGFLIVRGDPLTSFLLMEHKDRWDLPKGHLDGNESELECALRELREETGITENQIDIDPNFRFTTRYHVQSKRTAGRKKLKELVIFLAKLKTTQEIVPTEHQGFRWFPWNPPHSIQTNTIDPLLKSVSEHLQD